MLVPVTFAWEGVCLDRIYRMNRIGHVTPRSCLKIREPILAGQWCSLYRFLNLVSSFISSMRDSPNAVARLIQKPRRL